MFSDYYASSSLQGFSPVLLKTSNLHNPNPEHNPFMPGACDPWAGRHGAALRGIRYDVYGQGNMVLPFVAPGTWWRRLADT